MKTCEICGKEILEESAGCAFCMKTPGQDSGSSLESALLKDFRGYASKEGKKFVGVFKALDEEDAKRRLFDQGFEFIRIEPVVLLEEAQDHPFFPKFRLFLTRCLTQPIMIVVPIVLIFLGVTLYQNTLVAIKNQAAASAESARRATYPHIGDRIILQPGYFLTENKRIFNTALVHQRSGNIEALKALFAGQRRMLVTQEGMRFIYEGRDGVVPKAARVRFVDTEEILYVDHDGIDIERSKAEEAQRDAGASSGRSKTSAQAK